MTHAFNFRHGMAFLGNIQLEIIAWFLSSFYVYLIGCSKFTISRDKCMKKNWSIVKVYRFKDYQQFIIAPNTKNL